jgi:hypothetical protein
MRIRRAQSRSTVAPSKPRWSAVLRRMSPNDTARNTGSTITSLPSKKSTTTAFATHAPPAQDVDLLQTVPLAVADRQLVDAARWFQRLVEPKLAATLLAAWDWQLWCWGQDITQIPGNGLIRLQFERHSPPVGVRTPSCYRRTERHVNGPTLRIALWGHGLFLSDRPGKGVWLRRHSFAPCLHQCELFPPLNWSPSRSIIVTAPQSPADQLDVLRLTSRLLAWIADYEDQAIRAFGPDHRRSCHQTWAKTVPFPPDQSAPTWRQWAGHLQQLCSNPSPL